MHRVVALLPSCAVCLVASLLPETDIHIGAFNENMQHR
jgi:hypothetical protein